MRIIADEHVASSICFALTHIGEDIVRAGIGATDREIIAQAKVEGRIILTEDMDFGQLVFEERWQVPGVILVRAPRFAVARRAEVLSKLIAAGEAFEGVLTVIEPGGVRRRPLPVLKGPDEAS